MAMVIVTRLSKGNPANQQTHFLREQVSKMCHANNEYSNLVARLMKSGNPFDLEEVMHIRANLNRTCDTTILLISRVIQAFGLKCEEAKILSDVLRNLDKMYEDVSNAFFDTLSDNMNHNTSVAFYEMIGFDVDTGTDDESACCGKCDEDTCSCDCCDSGSNCDSEDEHGSESCAAAHAPESEKEPMPAEIDAARNELNKLREQVEKCVAYQVDDKFDPAKAAKLVGKISAAEQRVLILIGKVVKEYPGWENFTRSILCELGMFEALLCDVINDSITKDMDDDESTRFEKVAFDVPDNEEGDDSANSCECPCCGTDHAGNEQVLSALTSVVEQLTDATTKIQQQLKNMH